MNVTANANEAKGKQSNESKETKDDSEGQEDVEKQSNYRTTT